MRSASQWISAGLGMGWLILGCPLPGAEWVLLGVIEGDVERVEVAQPAAAFHTIERAVADQWHTLLRHPAVRAQRHFECREIVAAGRCADHRVALADDDD